jgi:hypothetical protein
LDLLIALDIFGFTFLHQGKKVIEIILISISHLFVIAIGVSYTFLYRQKSIKKPPRPQISIEETNSKYCTEITEFLTVSSEISAVCIY